jgi:hypothetical protein
MMKRRFEFEFEDQSSTNSISFEYDELVEEEINTSLKDETVVIFANRQVLLALAKVFIKIALCDYPKGFHLHLKKNFDADEEEILSIVLDGNS